MWYYLRMIISMYFHEASASFEIADSPFAPVCTLILAACVFAISFYPIAI